tara:strand:+ start:6731 stop:7219 length:489 start_codon:yes stop_codon:yes gene_type:complete
VFANSRDVADFFGKRHDNVLRAIDALDCSAYFRDLHFEFSPYTVEGQTRTYPAFDMTKDGFTLLVMGYTGQKAMEFKLRYIKRFNEMEATLREQQVQPVALPQDYRSALVALIAAEDDKARIAQEKQVVETKLVETEGTLDAAEKVMGRYRFVTPFAQYWGI